MLQKGPTNGTEDRYIETCQQPPTRRLEVDLSEQNKTDLISAYGIAQKEVDAQRLFRAPLSSEIRAVLERSGYAPIRSLRIRPSFNALNKERVAKGEPQLELCSVPDFLSLALIADAYAEAKRALDRNPLAKEVANVLSKRLNREISARRVRDKAAEYNLARPSERDHLLFESASYQFGFYPRDVLNQYQVYVDNHRKDPTPQTRYPRYRDLVELVKSAVPGSRPTRVNICSSVKTLRRQGHKIILQDGFKFSKRMLLRAIDQERDRCKREGKKLTPRVVTKALHSLYPGLHVSIGQVSSRLRAYYQSAHGADKARLEFDKKKPSLALRDVEQVYIACAQKVADIIPFPKMADLHKTLGYAVGTYKRHLLRLNRQRAHKKQLPYITGGSLAARDIKYMVACLGALDDTKKSPLPNPDVLSSLLRQSPGYCLEVLAQVSKHARKDRVDLVAGRTLIESSTTYRLGLLWALARSSLEPKEIKKTVRDGERTAALLVDKGYSQEELRYLQSAAVVLTLAETAGRLKGASVNTRFESWLTFRFAFDTLRARIDKIVDETIQPTGLTVAYSRDRQDALLRSVQRRMEETQLGFDACLPADISERSGCYQALIIKTMRCSHKKKLEVLRSVEQLAEKAGINFQAATQRLMYEPSLVSTWALREQEISRHVRVSERKAAVAQEVEFLRAHTKQQLKKLVSLIGERLRAGEDLQTVLEDLSIPAGAYRRMLYSYRSLTTSLSERLCILDRIDRMVVGGHISLAEAIIREQISEGVYRHWMQSRSEYASRLEDPNRAKVLHYLRDSYPREKRAILLREIYEQLQQGVRLVEVLRARWLPRDVYDSFVTDMLKRLSAEDKRAKLAMFESHAELYSVSEEALERGQVTLEALTAWRNNPVKLEKQFEYQTSRHRRHDATPQPDRLAWAESLIEAMQAAERDGLDTASVFNRFARGVKKGVVVQALTSLFAQRWPAHSPIKNAALEAMYSMEPDTMLLVNALFGSRYVQPGTPYKIAIMHRRLEMGLPVFNKRHDSP